MARTVKKEKNLTPEEKLAQALVPNVEQPYRMPENWCWVWHNSILDISGGSQPDKSLFIPEPKAGYTQLYQTRDYGEHPIPVFIPDKYAIKTTVEGDILLARYGGSLGKVFRAHAGAYNVALAKVTILRNDTINKEFLYYYYLSHFYQDFCVRAAYGRSAQAGFNRDDLAGLMFPLPPLSEQQRIVDRIESLFAKLDEAKEKAQAVVDGYEDRKAAILHKAFTGELTKQWREKNKITFSSWVKVKMQDVCEKITCGKTPKEHIATEGEVPFLKVYNIVNNEVDFETTPQYIPLAIHKGRLYSSILKPNDVIMNIVGPPLRKIAIIPNTYKEWNMNQAIVRFRPKEGLDYRYLYYSLVNPETLDDVIRATKGVVGQANISVSQSRNLEIMLPSMEEQQEVVRLLDMLIEKVQKAKEAAEQVIDQIDSMKKSILARAFRGELGTNDPADEPAIELLQKILA